MELEQWRDSCRIGAGTERSSTRRVDDVKVKKELMGSQIWAAMASMASMVWLAQGGTDVEVTLVPLTVATIGGDELWSRWMASMVGVGGGLGSSTQRALTWKSLCVPSSDGDTHSGSFAFRVNMFAEYQ